MHEQWSSNSLHKQLDARSTHCDGTVVVSTVNTPDRAVIIENRIHNYQEARDYECFA